MIDTIIGKEPTMNRHQEDPTPSVRKEVRELLRIARALQSDRRKNTRDRRKPDDRDVILDLSDRPERRTRLERRQNQEFLLRSSPTRERRQNTADRRILLNEGIQVTLSTRPNRRKTVDRRRVQSSSDTAGQRQNTKSEVRECLETVKGLIEKLQKHV